MLEISVPYCSKYIKETTSYSVQHISSLLGYENPENFIRAFKKEYGVSPSQFRGR
ncbi:MAG TPA: AraC family transcriptional regulator [Candidatus Limivivens intestinipullorum]|uniref:AraC family transcriptional regulator n=1 Tax=Candidatus Limivivens intestinipullorum TaxID=2840858 RepID=A0A9D1ERG5_9FIRM|nr:AraC family transcriptional regulator [Candidatus Limivivens intestinipullorum]